jgi:hypothetical protein
LTGWLAVGWVVRKSASAAPLEKRSIISVDRELGMPLYLFRILSFSLRIRVPVAPVFCEFIIYANSYVNHSDFKF